jgi:restriction endonuclease
LLTLLDPKDFELFVDLIFTTSGWRRVGILGKTQKTLDLDLVLPSTGERAFVQVKSETNSAELAEYVAKIDDDLHDRMFYVFHSGKRPETDDTRVTVIGPAQLADLVMDAGLVSWLIQKVS